MIKEIEVKAPLDTLNKIEATGLPCKWHSDGIDGSMTVTIDDKTDDDLLKLITALSGAKGFTFKCTKMDGHTITEVQKAIEQYGR